MLGQGVRLLRPTELQARASQRWYSGRCGSSATARA